MLHNLKRVIRFGFMKCFFCGDARTFSWVSFNREDAWIFAKAALQKRLPLISVLVPVYNPEPTVLRECLTSVGRQIYRQWELCIVDDASSDPKIREILNDFACRDRRIRVEFAGKNRGIAKTINKAARMARGQFLGVLDHDDILDPSALLEYARLILKQPDIDLIYCDEDKIDENGVLCDPWFKSDWNPDLSLSFNYVMHFALFRNTCFQRVGGVHEAYEGSQDYDLLLRVAEQTDRIAHIPKILYHWRKSDASIASEPGAKPGVFVNGLAALNAALKRRGIDGTAEDAPRGWKGIYRVRRAIDQNLSCSLIIAASQPGDDGLNRLLQSIQGQKRFHLHEIIVCQDGHGASTRVPADGLPIRWMNTGAVGPCQQFNAAAGSTGGDLLMFLDDTMALRSKQSISALIEQAQRPEVGATGGKVYYANGLVEHTGVLLGPFGLLGYAHRATPDDSGYVGIKNMIGNFSAVMGLGMMTKRSLFETLGGFDTRFGQAYWDVDYCLRARERHFFVTYTPYATFTHHIPVPAIDETIVEPDATFFKTRWPHLIARDPFFNPNFSRSLECYHISDSWTKARTILER